MEIVHGVNEFLDVISITKVVSNLIHMKRDIYKFNTVMRGNSSDSEGQGGKR